MKAKLLFSSLLISVFCLLGIAHADEPERVPFSIPEALINAQLLGKTFSGTGKYNAGPVLGEIPYDWKITNVTCSLKEGYVDVKGTAEVSSNGYGYKESISGTVKVSLNAKTQTVKAIIRSFTIPLYVPWVDGQKKVGTIDLAAAIGPQEVVVSPFLDMASSFFGGKKGATLQRLNVAVGMINAEVALPK